MHASFDPELFEAAVSREDELRAELARLSRDIVRAMRDNDDEAASLLVLMHKEVEADMDVARLTVAEQNAKFRRDEVRATIASLLDSELVGSGDPGRMG